MRVLHLVKTGDSAPWAAHQAVELARRGVEIHVAMPSPGRTAPFWREAMAVVHPVRSDMPVRRPWLLPRAIQAVRELVREVRPDLIHSHFVGPTLTLRLALGKDHPTPRIFQVAGPLHLEHPFYRAVELATAGPRDSWIGTSRCIVEHYRRAGVPEDRLFLSYAGLRLGAAVPRRGALRSALGISPDALVVGNCSYMYSPKYYLGQTVGLKCHEDVIDALHDVLRADRRVVGLLAGGPGSPGGDWYLEKLRRRAARVAGDRIKMPGFLDGDLYHGVWSEFDCVVHVPLSENCGGVVEPLLHSVPTIGSRVGGIPEVVFEGRTGSLVAPREPRALARTIERTLSRLEDVRRMARTGASFVRTVFDVTRTAAEVFAIYDCVLGRGPRPIAFDGAAHLAEIEASGTNRAAEEAL